MGYRSLRVLNDDVVEPDAGFGEHGHRDMEIISWVIDGGLRHGDSTGTRGVIRPGDLQVMTAGRGIRHSEMNASATEPVHFLQIWIEPAKHGVEPSYEQTSFPPELRKGRWQTLVSPDGRDDSMRIGQDALLYVADLAAGEQIDVVLHAGRFGYLHVVTGSVRFGDTILNAGDALSYDSASAPTVTAIEASQLFAFDLA